MACSVGSPAALRPVSRIGNKSCPHSNVITSCSSARVTVPTRPGLLSPGDSPYYTPTVPQDQLPLLYKHLSSRLTRMANLMQLLHEAGTFATNSRLPLELGTWQWMIVTTIILAPVEYSTLPIMLPVVPWPYSSPACCHCFFYKHVAEPIKSAGFVSDLLRSAHAAKANSCCLQKHSLHLVWTCTGQIFYQTVSSLVYPKTKHTMSKRRVL